jgi:collagenase-like PrtC family protease
MAMSAEIVLGPVLFNWSPEVWRDFHFRIADEAPVDCVHLGEVVCAKRAPFVAPYADDVLARLEAAGKEVVLSTLALVGGAREAAAMAELIDGADMLIEANDLGLADLLGGRAHAIGPFVNVYNEHALAVLAARGALRVCLPPELPQESLAAIALGAPPDVALEVLAFGRIPLAISARCFHARVHGLHKDACRFVCGNDPDGLATQTIDGQIFVAVNGVQTLSSVYGNLVGELASLRAMGIERFRLSPHTCDMVGVAEIFRAVAEERIDAQEANARLAGLLPGHEFANGFFHAMPGHLHRQAAALADT